MIGTALMVVVLLGCAALLVLRAVSMRRLRTVRQLEQIQAYGFAGAGANAADADDHAEARPSAITQLGRIVARFVPASAIQAARKQLLSAGFHTTSVETYLGYRALAVAGMPLLMIWFATATGAAAGMAVVEVAFGAGMGWLMPKTFVSRRARLRLEQIDYEMPELVDLLLVGVESGMGLNGAMRVASARVPGPLGEEMLLVLRQQSLGASTNESLKNMLDRSDTPAMRSFVRTITQGERLGVSIGQMMRSLAEEMRKRRKAHAEEKAHKTPIKILFPLVFMILPSMFIVLLTPAILNMVKFFSGT